MFTFIATEDNDRPALVKMKNAFTEVTKKQPEEKKKEHLTVTTEGKSKEEK